MTENKQVLPTETNDGGQTPDDQKDSKRSMVVREVIDWIKIMGVVLVLTLLVRFFVFTPVLVDGLSMFPNLHDKELMFVTRFVKYIEPVERGDIVILVPPAYSEESGTYYVKRVIGLPGERLKIEGGVVYINGAPLDEYYIEDEWYGNYAEIIVPTDCYFVMGDNRNFSHDSRASSVGPIHKSKIQGRAVAVMWPLSEMKSVTLKQPY